MTHDDRRHFAGRDDRYLSRTQAADVLGLTRSTLDFWHSKKPEMAPPMRRHGRKAMYSLRDLQEWSDRRKV